MYIFVNVSLSKHIYEGYLHRYQEEDDNHSYFNEYSDRLILNNRPYFKI